MRGWKVGGTGAVFAIVVVVAVVAAKGAAGDETPSLTPTGVTPGQGGGGGDGRGAQTSGVRGARPFKPPTPGPGAITLDQQTPQERANINAIKLRVEAAQPRTSYEAYSSATSVTIERARAEIAARQVGLEGTADDGVTP